jgi:threonine/homoserine/homoserine lactone efflux protein
MFSIILNGISTGLLLQFAIGPIFFYILNISIQRTLLDGIFAVIAVVIVDYLYIMLAIAGVGRLLEIKKTKIIFGLSSAIVLIAFGLMMICFSKNNLTINVSDSKSASDYLSSFLSTFLLTISSPLTIVFWTSLFATKAIENNYSKNQLIVFGISAGMATLIFLGGCVIIFSVLKSSISLNLVQNLNVIVGVVLIVYAITRIIKLYKDIA